ncbi:hypothetical protein E2C01_028147 [Portunus trituberculatus]|uniref:Uncharacterized protein n=1 Tax=Portunus trituberculatus TaxID=210409 RepID=A0A5B7ENF3_PORTR|nr:hypothetical protein [Portunus trituberculatus]
MSLSSPPRRQWGVAVEGFPRSGNKTVPLGVDVLHLQHLGPLVMNHPLLKLPQGRVGHESVSLEWLGEVLGVGDHRMERCVLRPMEASGWRGE